MNVQEQLLQLLAPLWKKEIDLKRNQYLLTAGTIDTNIYLILKGSVRVFIMDQEGHEHTVRFGYKNSFTGGLDSFITNKPTKFHIQALRESKLQCIDKDSFDQLIQQSSENLKIWKDFLELVVHQQLDREMDLIITTPIERLQRVYKRSPQLFQEIPHKYIASYLRMTPETLSRSLKNLDLNQ